MAPLPKSLGVSVGNGMLFENKPPAKNGKFWRWFLAGTLLNLFVTSVVVGMTVVYVHKELQSVRDEMTYQEERLAWLEEAVSKEHGEKMNLPIWKSARFRQRRDQDTAMDSRAHLNVTFTSRQDARNAGFCSCRDGRDGKDGKDGRDGVQGPPGAAGPKGEKCEKGDVGIDVDQESPGLTAHRRLKRETRAMDSSLTIANKDHDDLRPPGGDTYVRWGRTTCPNGTGTELVYQGFAASSHSSHKGGAVDFFCLPTQPDWPATFNDGSNSQSYLYGVEYEVAAFDPFSHENAEFLNDRDVPCAVCRLVDRGTQLLVPAKLGCPENWTEEYRGFLMSGKHNQEQRSKALCVDQAPEAIPSSQANAGGALLYFIEGQCGSLPCPPYVTGREMACTVCSI